MVAHQVEEAGDVGAGLLFFFLGAVGSEGLADFVDEVDEGVNVSVSFAHRGGFPVFHEPDDLEDLDFEALFGDLEGGLAEVSLFGGFVDFGFEFIEGLAPRLVVAVCFAVMGFAVMGVIEGLYFRIIQNHGGDDGLEAADVAVVVGAEDGDEFFGVGGAVELVFVVGDVAGDVGQASVGAAEDAVLVVAEFGGAEPQGCLRVMRCGVPELMRLELARRVELVGRHRQLC